MPDNHVILPIGIIKESTKAGTTIRLIPPHPSTDKLQPQATILTRDSSTGAHARTTVPDSNPGPAPQVPGSTERPPSGSLGRLPGNLARGARPLGGDEEGPGGTQFP